MSRGIIHYMDSRARILKGITWIRSVKPSQQNLASWLYISKFADLVEEYINAPEWQHQVSDTDSDEVVQAAKDIFGMD